MDDLLIVGGLVLAAVAVLRRDFASPDQIGPRRVAEFVTGGADDEIQADVVGFIAQLLAAIP